MTLSGSSIRRSRYHRVIELHLLLFSALYFDQPECLTLLCSGGSSKVTKHWSVTCEVASNYIFDAHTSALQEEMVKFCKAALEGSHQRETARNSWNSAWSHRGGEKGARVSFRTPGAFHHACWMANAIYGTNIFLFQQQFSQLPKKSTV